MNLKRIAIVDNDVRHAVFYQKAIESLGYFATIFEDPRSILQNIKDDSQRFDIYICDIMMPSFDMYSNQETDNGLLTGICLAKDIRQIDCEAPIFLLTNLNIQSVLKQIQKIVSEYPNMFLVKKGEYLPAKMAQTIDAILNDNAIPDQRGIVRRFLSSLIIQPTFAGIGIDLKRLVEKKKE